MQLNRQERFAAIIVILTLTCGLLALVTGHNRPGTGRAETLADGCCEGQQEADSFLRLDLNRATLDELVALPGIGPRRAEAIVKLRQERGQFDRIDDLLSVRGIGEKTLELIEPYVYVSPSGTKSE